MITCASVRPCDWAVPSYWRSHSRGANSLQLTCAHIRMKQKAQGRKLDSRKAAVLPSGMTSHAISLVFDRSTQRSHGEDRNDMSTNGLR